MCSIVVTFNESQPQILRSMAVAVSHRGPDSLEVLNRRTYGVAGCRLTIFGDPDAPMVHEDPESGRIVLFNGEIYNYHLLWQSLESHGIQPKTNLEAELVARLYDLNGLGFPSQLMGMFALAIVDENRLILVRDRFGIKPLYYSEAGSRVIVCSEIKGLLKHPDISPALDIEALEQTRVFGYVFSRDKTFFKGIKQVTPGTVIAFDSFGGKNEERFSEFPAAQYLNGGIPNDYPATVKQIKSKVINSVDRMLRHGDMEKGLYLSGGMDSTTIAFVAAKELGYPLQAFTLGDSHETPDVQSARRVAQVLGIAHQEIIISEKDYWRWLPDYIAHYESLMAGGVFHIQGGLAFHILSNSVSEHVRVAFSGEGADELFGGYYWIYTHPLGFSDRIRSNLAAIESNQHIQDIVDGLFPRPEDERTYRRNLFDCLLRGGLSNYHLQSVDRSAGAFGFEVRPVYLDDELSELAMELPIDYKVPDKTTTKKVLRDAFRADYDELGLGWVTSRLKYGMPSAIDGLDKAVSARVETAIEDKELVMHPFGSLLGSKMNLVLYDLFEHIFFRGWDHHADTPPPGSYLERLWLV